MTKSSINESSPVSGSMWCIFDANILCLQCSLHVLSKAFEFDIRWGIGGNTYCCARSVNGLIAVMGLNSLHFFKVQSKEARFRKGQDSFIDSIFKTHIMKPTHGMQKEVDWLLSVFHDNSGVIAWNDDWSVCMKAEITAFLTTWMREEPL